MQLLWAKVPLSLLTVMSSYSSGKLGSRGLGVLGIFDVSQITNAQVHCKNQFLLYGPLRLGSRVWDFHWAVSRTPF